MPGSGQQQDGASGSHGATQSWPHFAKAPLHRTVLKPTPSSSQSACPAPSGPPNSFSPHSLQTPKQQERQGRVFQGRGGERGYPSSRLAAVPHRCPTACPHHVSTSISFPPLRAPTCDVFAGNYFLQSVCHSGAISILPQFGLSFSLMIYLKKMIPQAKHFSVIITHGK